MSSLAPTMYSHHLGLAQEPFSIAPDPRFLFMSERHREALAHLLYGVRAEGAGSGGFVLLTGDIGTGKTTVCRCFLEQVPANAHVAYIFNPKLSVSELLQSICEEFHISLPEGASQTPSTKVCIDALNAFLLQSHAAGQSCVLIIDEAQNLEPEVLEQLRLLTNLETNERKLLQIVLIGQPELRTMLARAELEQLAQRVIARFHLQALNAEETRQYIAHRLGVAGHQGPLPFDESALAHIHRLSHGVPRRINLLCDRALLGAWANGLERIDRRVIEAAAQEVFGGQAARAHPLGRKPLTVVLGALVLGLGIWGWQHRTAVPWPVAQAPTPSAPSDTAALAQASQPKRKPAASVDLQALLTQPRASLDQSWQALAALWQRTLPNSQPCQSEQLQGLQCYQTNKLNLVQLRQLDRPGIISLRNGQGDTLFALLLGLNAHSALLQIQGTRYQIGQLALAQQWPGDFATLWDTPPMYQADLRIGASGPAIELLAQGLAKLDGQALNNLPASLDASLRERVRNFQRNWGLSPDGQPGPLTFMQLARATDAPGPRLLTAFD